MDRHPDRMRIRRDTIEHTFGTLKSWMGNEHFLTKTLGNVSTEMSLHVLAYNIKRVIAIMGVDGLIRAIKVHLMLILALIIGISPKTSH